MLVDEPKLLSARVRDLRDEKPVLKDEKMLSLKLLIVKSRS